METMTVWGVVKSDGNIDSGSEGFSITRQTNGEYIISFAPKFAGTPAITGSQVLYGQPKQDPADGVVFPFVNNGAATVLTGADSGLGDRSFAFIAVGPK